MGYRITAGRVELDGVSLYYECAGSGPALVFLHGLGGNHLSWWQQVPYFMRSYRCVTVDQRGFGLSADRSSSFVDAHPSDLNALLDHLKIERAVLVGQSMGGWTIVGCALERPERIAALVMADTPGGIFTAEMTRQMSARPPLKLSDTPPIGSLPTYAADYFARRPEFAYLYDALKILGSQPPTDAMRRIGGRRYDLALVRERLTMPVLCIVGEEDVLIPPAVIGELVRALPDARLITVPDCGHSVYFEHPTIFNQAVRDFLRQTGYGSGRS